MRKQRLAWSYCLSIVQGASEEQSEVYINTASEHHSLQHNNIPEASAELPALLASRLMGQEGRDG